MSMIAPSSRLRRTPFSPGVDAAGASAFSVYNHTLLPVVFESVEADYHHLKRHVQLWDVSCERQIELVGPDAECLIEMLTPRDMSKMVIGQCMYLPVVDAQGGMLNDPVALKLSDNRYWISIADSDLLLWIKGIATALQMDVRVFEPDVNILAIQGPKSFDLAARVFGEDIRDLKFFRYGHFDFQDQTFLIARSGFSKQGGYEIYIQDPENGMMIWNALFAAGADLNVRAGCPNGIERVEGGLLSYGGDMTANNTPYECGLDKFCHPYKDTPFIGQAALQQIAETGAQRQIRPIRIEGPVPSLAEPWPTFVDDQRVGQVTAAFWSPDHNCTVAIGMIDRPYWDAGRVLEVKTPEGLAVAQIQDAFWA